MTHPTPQSKPNTTRVISVIVVLAIAALCVALAIKFAGPGKPGFLGPMVQMLESDSFVVVWHDPDRTSSQVRVTASSEEADRTLEVDAKQGRFEAVIEGLESGTTYLYEIHAADKVGQAIAKGSARTSPGRDSSFSFMAFGDGGTGETIQYDLAKIMQNYPVELIVHTGDLVYMDGEREDYPSKFWHPYEPILKNTALYPIAGNHDVPTDDGLPMFETFVLPRNGPENTDPERHYWFDYGDVRFVGMDSDDSYETIEQKVAPWLDRVLADAGDRWKVLFFHHGIYTNGKYEPNGKMKTCIEPLCDKHNVELVLVGHNHMYERTHPICDGKVVEPARGTVYITTAAGGAKLYEIKKVPIPEVVIQNNKTWSFTVIDVSSERMSGKQISIDNEVIDEFELLRAGSMPIDSEAGG